MDSRLEVELHDIKKSLEKCLPEINNEEQIYDLICALERIPLTPKLIKETKLGNLMSSIRNKFKESTPKISEKASALLVIWKKLVEASMNEKRHTETNDHDKKESHHHAKPITANFVQPVASSSSGFGGAKLDQLALNDTANSLPASRKIVFNIFLNTLKPSCTADVATSVALQIEKGLFALYPADLKSYTNKAKSLSFNLKKNEVRFTPKLRVHNALCTTHYILSLFLIINYFFSTSLSLSAAM